MTDGVDTIDASKVYLKLHHRFQIQHAVAIQLWKRED